MNRVHFSSQSDEWETPEELFLQLSKLEGPFQLDVCATSSNAKCLWYWTKEQDSLSRSWSDAGDQIIAWMNPPYGRGIIDWMRKAYEESLKGVKVVCLVPSRTDTRWWHEYAMKGRITFLRGRLKFSGHRNAAPFPSAVVVFDAKRNTP